MKKIITALLILLAAAAFFTGCQATPDKPIVVQKDTEQLIDAAAKNTDNKTLAEMVKAPAKMALSVQDGSGSVTVNADADVVVPDAPGISTLRVKKHSFTQAEAGSMLQYFIGGGDFNSTYAGENDELGQSGNLWNKTKTNKVSYLSKKLLGSIPMHPSRTICSACFLRLRMII